MQKKEKILFLTTEENGGANAAQCKNSLLFQAQVEFAKKNAAATGYVWGSFI